MAIGQENVAGAGREGQGVGAAPGARLEEFAASENPQANHGEFGFRKKKKKRERERAENGFESWRAFQTPGWKRKKKMSVPSAALF